MKTILLDHKDILLKLEKLERKVGGHDGNFRAVFICLRELMRSKVTPMRKIGFRQNGVQAIDRLISV